jgi:PleD family two-component response regulator
VSKPPLWRYGEGSKVNVMSVGIRILIVDDAFVWRMLLRNHLEKHNYEVTGASDFNMALRLLSEDGPFNLVITDWVLLGCENGFAVINAIRVGLTEKAPKGTRRDVPIILSRSNP